MREIGYAVIIALIEFSTRLVRLSIDHTKYAENVHVCGGCCALPGAGQMLGNVSVWR